MTIAIVTLAVGMWAGVPMIVVTASALAVALPNVLWPFLAGAAIVSVVHRRREEVMPDIPSFLVAMAGELRAGRSLRAALASTVTGHPELGIEPAGRLAAAGRPMDEVAAALANASPELAPAAAALEVSARTGGKVAEAFESLALDAVDEVELRRQLRADSAPARLSALVVAGFPLVVLAIQVGTGGLGRIGSLGAVGLLMLVVGLGLLALGVVLTVGLLTRSGRRSRAEVADEQMILFTRVLVVALTGGVPLHSALGVAVEHSHGPLRHEVGMVLRMAGRLGLAGALMADRGGMAGALMSRLAASQLSGAPAVASATGFLADVRSRIRSDRLRRARRLPVQLMFPLGLLILPGFILVFAGPLVVGSLTELFGSLP